MGMTLICAFSLSAVQYTDWVIGTLEALEAALAGAMSGVAANVNTTTIYHELDQTVATAFEKIQYVGDRMSALKIWHATYWFWLFTGVCMAAAMCVLVFLGGATIIVAKFALKILFALGPIFILSLLFPPTARYFDQWFAQVINYILVVVIVATILTFGVTAFGAFVEAIDFTGNTADVNPLLAGIQVLIMGLVLHFLIKQSHSMAVGLAGGMAMAALSVRDLSKPLRFLNNIINKQSTRMDMRTGMPRSDSRASHLLAGNTPLNPAYRQRVSDTGGISQWGRANGGKIEAQRR